MNTQRTQRSRFFVGIGVVVLVLLVWIASSFFSVFQLSRAIQESDTNKISRHSSYLYASAKLLSAITLQQSSNIESAHAVLHIASQADIISTELEHIKDGVATETIDISNLLETLASLENDLETLQVHLPDCSLCREVYPETDTATILQTLSLAQKVSRASSVLAESTHRYLVVLQNSDELRATGGFTGSYTVITIQDGVVQPIHIRDIYDADGQFTGFIPAPHGVDEYLSSSNGLRLPDANWDPHFPTSAKQMLQFFALGDTNDIEGVIAITDNYFEDIVEAIGPIWLPDYQVEVTAENLTSVLRSDREDFFAGSIQKKHLLEQFQNQLLIALPQLQPEEIIAITATHMHQKNILGYSSDDDMSALFSALEIDGKIQTDPSKDILAFVESNVGINKANKGVTRAVSLSSEGEILTARYFIQNSNTAPSATNLDTLIAESKEVVKSASASAQHLGYVNYQRVLYPKSWQIKSVSIPNQSSPVLNTETRQLSASNTIQETGFLVVIPEQSSTVVTIVFTLPEPVSFSELELYKQPGVDPIPVWLESDQSQPFSGNPTLILEKNHATITP